MYSKQRSMTSWWMALWIYGLTFFLVTLTFFQAANAGDNPVETTSKDLSSTVQADGSRVTETSKDTKLKDETKKVEKNSTKRKGKIMLVEIETNHGKIKIQLNSEKAPKTVENFLSYVDSGFYNGTIFHRVIKGFMIQGGGFAADMTQKPTNAPVKNEANNGLLNKRGTLAMARTMDPHSASAQFFINLVDNAFLDFKSETLQGWGYAVFGEVVEGMDVVDKIASVKTTSKKGHDDVPDVAVELKSVKRIDK